MNSGETDRLAARLLEAEKPADVVQAGARWLSELLAAEGFIWVRSRQALERKAAGRGEAIRLESSKWNRSGHLIKFSVVNLSVRDDGLRSWRRANPGLTVHRAESVDAIVSASSFLDMSRDHMAVLTVPERRFTRLETLAAHLRETALPWFASSQDPKQLAQTVPDALLTPWGFAQDLVEFLISRDELAEARTLVERVLALGPVHQAAFAQGQELARRGERPEWHTPPALGWSCSVLGLD